VGLIEAVALNNKSQPEVYAGAQGVMSQLVGQCHRKKICADQDDNLNYAEVLKDAEVHEWKTFQQDVDDALTARVKAKRSRLVISELSECHRE
jgi:hypothetical protein